MASLPPFQVERAILSRLHGARTRRSSSRVVAPRNHLVQDEKMAKGIGRRSDADPEEGVRRYGKVKFADPINRKYPIDSPGHIKAAWAYIHQPDNAA